MMINKTILRNISGNFLGIIINLFNQVILVPFYLSSWGVNLYGDWIALTAVSSFFSMSDIGLNTVTNNQYSIAYNKGDHSVCDSLMANNALLIIAIFSIVFFVGCPVLICLDVERLFSLRAISKNCAIIVILALILKIFISMLSSVYSSVFRAVSRAYVSFYMGNFARFADALIVLLGLLCSFKVSVIAVLCVCPYVILLLWYAYNTHEQYGISLKLWCFDKSLFIKLLRPSVSFLSFPLGYAIILQGFTLIVNRYFGASDVVLFNTTRTMCNFVKVIPNALKNAVWPEFTIAYAKHDFYRMKTFHNKTLFSVIAIIFLVAFFLFIFGNPIYTIWTKGAVVFCLPLMVLYMISVLFNSVWETSGMALMATNKHSRMGVFFVILSFFSFFVALFLAMLGFSLLYNVGMVIFTDFCMAIFVLKQSYKLLKGNV